MKRNKVVLAMAISLSSLCYTARALCEQPERISASEMQITNVPVEVSPSNRQLPPQLNSSMPEQNMSSNRSNGASIDPSDIINLGKLLWDIVQAGKPVVNTQTDFASALPAGMTDLQGMSGWSAPMAKPFFFNWSILGVKTVTFNYSIFYTYGGNLNGVGQYLANVMVVPTNVYVIWGYDFSASATVGQVLNVGTKENPKSAMQLELKMALTSFVDHYETTATFYITGDGQFKQLSGPVLSLDQI